LQPGHRRLTVAWQSLLHSAASWCPYEREGERPGL
jgi:hypothetical protein